MLSEEGKSQAVLSMRRNTTLFDISLPNRYRTRRIRYVLASYDERGLGLKREPRPVIDLKDMHHNVDKGYNGKACNPPVTYLNRGLMT